VFQLSLMHGTNTKIDTTTFRAAFKLLIILSSSSKIKLAVSKQVHSFYVGRVKTFIILACCE